ncbi:MAG: DUF2971 domain-containing protein [Hyphomicrobiales bacterium]|nr:MAG: DUF2971 domain-containing protein [Hyphomicrobiales bacterium]
MFSLSEIERSEIDGRLSMWRAYGADGNGGAIVFDAGKIIPAEGRTPLMIVRVQYGDTATRKAWIDNKVSEIAALVKENTHEESDTNAIAFHAFERIKLFALTSKHSGFAEEREWRVIYWPDQDRNNDFKKLRSYHNGAKGIEPKLKLNMHEANKITGGNDKLEDYICNIILGPSRASVLNREAMKRMLEEIDLGHLVEKIKVSSIPYRNTK